LREKPENKLSVETTTHERHILFQPTVVLVTSLVAATVFGLYLVRGSLTDSGGLRFPPSFFYVVPIVVPFVAFLLDRAEHIRETTAVAVIIDVVVVGLAVARVFSSFPFISGHTLFLTYAIGSSRSTVAVVTASLVMLQVIYLKYFVWHDLVTSTGGIILGALATIVVRRIQLEGKS
jgi:hypothetical protein